MENEPTSRMTAHELVEHNDRVMRRMVRDAQIMWFIKLGVLIAIFVAGALIF